MLACHMDVRGFMIDIFVDISILDKAQRIKLTEMIISKCSFATVIAASVQPLKNLFPDPATRPGAVRTAQNWASEMDVTLTLDDGSVLTHCGDFAGAGASRRDYAGRDCGFAFKLADVGRYHVDDNKAEYEADLPGWLIPKVDGYVSNIQIAGVKTSVLVVEKCGESLHDLGVSSLQGRTTTKDLEYFVMGIVSGWHLFARVAADSALRCSDWTLSNLMITTSGSYDKVLLVDWAGTQTEETSTPTSV